MESWRKVWREGFAPILDVAHLLVLRDALRSDDARLLQSDTVKFSHFSNGRRAGIVGACAICMCAWLGDEMHNIEDVEEFFSRTCFEADTELDEPSASRWFLNWYDETPRDEMRRELLPEVEWAIDEFSGRCNGSEPVSA